MAPYNYTPLLSGKELRLLRLLPGPESEDIQVELFTVDFKPDNPPYYEALSYVWGSTRDRHTIKVHHGSRGKTQEVVKLIGHLLSRRKKAETLAVTQNLETALRHLRLLNRTRVFWVDAICINQNDLTERNAEVGRMGTIYSKASQVVVWLGPEGEDSNLAVATLRAIGDEAFYDPGTRATYSRDDTETAFLSKNKQAIKLKQASWVAVKNLLKRDWFKRLWIVQEIKSAAQAVILIGYSSISWPTFNVAFHWIWARIVPFVKVFNEIGFLGLEFLISEQKKFSLGYIIHSTKRSTCVDSRDRVYAILSLIDLELNIEPNYRLSPEEVYKDFTVHYIKASSRLEILRLCVMQSQLLPSWVPNLSIPVPTGTTALHRASGKSVHEFNAPVDSNITIQGMYISSIGHISDPVLQVRRLPDIQTLCDSWLPNDILTANYKYGGTLIDAYLNTLVFGAVKENTPNGFGRTPSVEDYRSFYNRCIRGQQTQRLTNIEVLCRDQLLEYLSGRTLFTTTNGYIGICPVDGSRCEDQICVILGIGAPLLLRPVPGQHGHYRMVGECYVHGLMNGEGLLGPIPNPWKMRTLNFDGYRLEIWEHASEGRTHDDPRLGSLPAEWRRSFKDNDGSFTYQPFDSDGTPHYPYFENIETGFRSTSDPRLTPEALRARGTDIRDFVLV